MSSWNRARDRTIRNLSDPPRRLRKAASFYLWHKSKSIVIKLFKLWLLVFALKCLFTFWPFIFMILRPVFEFLSRLFDLSV